MEHLSIDISRIARLDVHRCGQRISGGTMFPRNPAGPAQRTLVSTAVNAAARVSPTAKLIKEVVDLAQVFRGVSMSIVGGRGPLIAPPPPSPFITIAAGGSSQAFAFIGVAAGAGLYGSNSPELGLYTSSGGGLWTNIGVSTGLQFAYVLGPPSTMAGLGWQVGVDVDIPGLGFGLGAAIMLGASGPPYEFQGWCFGISVGVSALPVTFSFQVANTQLLPLATPARVGGRP